MDKRTAKREACWRAACVIEDAMSGGWPAEHYATDQEFRQVSEALHNVITELERRGAQAVTSDAR